MTWVNLRTMALPDDVATDIDWEPAPDATARVSAPSKARKAERPHPKQHRAYVTISVVQNRTEKHGTHRSNPPSESPHRTLQLP
jgi:hypothetical protein